MALVPTLRSDQFAPTAKPESFGVLLDLLGPVAPQDDAVGVDHDHQMAGVLGRRQQDVTQHRQHPGQLPGVPAEFDLIGTDRIGVVATVVGIHPET